MAPPALDVAPGAADSAVTAASPSLQERMDAVVEWVQKAMENRNTRIAVGVAGAAAAAAVLYLIFGRTSTAPASSSSSSSSSSLSSSAKKKAKKAKKNAAAAAAAAATSGASPAAEKEKVEAVRKATGAGTPAPTVEATTRDVPAQGTAAKAPLSDAIASAADAKARGNELYKSKDYEGAIAAYSQGIEVSPADHPSVAVLYSNRAACYAHLKEHDKVIADCTAALAIDPRYVKALHRRAVAYEATEQLQEALYDYMLLNVLEGFAKNELVTAFDKVLRDLSEKMAKELYATRTPRMPSAFYISAYLDGFRKHPLADQPTLAADEAPATLDSTDGDHQYRTAISFAAAKKFDESLAMLEAALAHNTQYSNAARNLLGTFLYLRGDLQRAFDLFDELVKENEKDVNALIKRGSVLMELSKQDEALADFERALQYADDQTLSDVYYHRGNVYFLMDKPSAEQMLDPTKPAPPHDPSKSTLPQAIADYQKAIELNPTIAFTYVQLAVAQYRNKEVDAALKTFEKAEELFPQSADVLNYHGEVLFERQQIDEAVKKFNAATHLKPTTPLAFINKGLSLLQKNRIDDAIAQIKKAIEVDDRCDMAYLQLAQLHQQQNMLDEALAYYDKALELGRSVSDMTQVLAYREAIKAQLHMVKRFSPSS